MRWLDFLIRTACGLVIGLFAVPWSIDLLVDTVRRLNHLPPHPIAIGVGLALGLGWWTWRRPNAFYHTWVHEHCHLLMCILLFVEVSRIEASKAKGGSVEHVQADPVRATFIGIAPYTLPLVLAPFLLARIGVTTGPWSEILSGLVAFFYCTHLQGLVVNVRQNFWASDADLPRVGHVLALVLITCALALTTVAVITVLHR